MNLFLQIARFSAGLFDGDLDSDFDLTGVGGVSPEGCLGGDISGVVSEVDEARAGDEGGSTSNSGV